jgi:hypothetical protein
MSHVGFVPSVVKQMVAPGSASATALKSLLAVSLVGVIFGGVTGPFEPPVVDFDVPVVVPEDVVVDEDSDDPEQPKAAAMAKPQDRNKALRLLTSASWVAVPCRVFNGFKLRCQQGRSSLAPSAAIP